MDRLRSRAPRGERASGTGVAAKELDRFFVGAETEREYAELAARRIGSAARGEVLRELPALGAANG